MTKYYNNEQPTVNNEQFTNEPNFSKRPVLRSFPLAKKEPNLPRGIITHLNNEQQTMNHKQFTNEPNFKITKINVSSFIT